MKNFVKKVLCLAVVAVMAFSIVACSDSNVKDDPALVEFVEEEGDVFVESFESSFEASSGGLTCDCSIDVKGTTLIVECLFNGVDDVDDDVKKQMQEIYDESKSVLKASFEPLKDEAPNLSHVYINICEEDGDRLASVDLEF